jgi:hypothetical protein
MILAFENTEANQRTNAGDKKGWRPIISAASPFQP